MPDAPWDAIIVGQGLAGTTLAWHFHDAGQKVLILDANESVTSSKIAAGLITPITGQRMTLDPLYDSYFPAAQTFYANIEKQTSTRFFNDRAAIRFLKAAAEKESWAQRSQRPEFQRYLCNPQPLPLVEPALADIGGGGFAMQAAQLDVAAYLSASAKHLPTQSAVVDWNRDVTLLAGAIDVAGFRTRRLISCEGYAATRNPYFNFVRFRAAKGEILTVQFDTPLPSHVLHHGIWLAPTADAQVFRAGSTYDWQTLDQVPTASARDDIERGLRELLRVPYRVIDHQAAVRPIIQESKALVGLHPAHASLGFFNGLGSKGALLAPWFAQQFTDYLVRGAPIAQRIDVRRHVLPDRIQS